LSDREAAEKRLRIQEAREAYEAAVDEWTQNRALPLIKFILNRNRDAETIAFLLLEEEEQSLLLN
jgi:hypothetical protein